MKKVIFLLILLNVIYLSTCFSQTGWLVHSTGTNKPINDIYFVTANTGWAVGDSVIVKSTNGGVNWIQQNIYYPGGALLYSVKFLNENTGFAGGGKFTSEYTHTQYLFKTTNGGINWNMIWNPQNIYTGWVNNILLINENIIYISLYGHIEVFTLGGVYKSTNGGMNFTQCIAGGGYSSLSFINVTTGWTTVNATSDMAETRNSKILKTSNGGLNWSVQFRDSGFYSASISNIQFFNELTGYGTGWKYFVGTVFYKTTNGGANWDTICYYHNKYSSMFFINTNTGWISGSANPDSFCIACTTNGGVNWQKQFKNSTYNVSRLKFINNLTGWAIINYNSIILRTTTGGIAFVNNISNNIPDKYYLYQNYPNPFNPSTNIKYQISKNIRVNLKIYNILGKEIATIVNEKQSPGTYEASFDGCNLSSGIYFYKLETNEFSDTKRMILLK